MHNTHIPALTSESGHLKIKKLSCELAVIKNGYLGTMEIKSCFYPRLYPLNRFCVEVCHKFKNCRTGLANWVLALVLGEKNNFKNVTKI